MLEKPIDYLSSLASKYEVLKNKAFRKGRFAKATAWSKWHWFLASMKIVTGHYGGVTAVVMCLVLYVAGLFFLSDLSIFINCYFSTDSQLSNLRTLYVSMGGALVGASAIAFSFVMFAMQVNVERLPHGLFRAFNKDARIVGSFVGTILLSVVVACFSLIPNTKWVASSIYNSFWSFVGIFILFLFAYRRALTLINPTKQLGILTKIAKRDFKMVVRRSIRARPFFESDGEDGQEETIDIKRLAYFKKNPHWSASGVRACDYAMSYVNRYTEMGDYDVAENAFGALVSVNAAYVAARGKTYFSHFGLMENPTAHDSFINNTLEHLRQNLRGAVVRGDERHIELVFKALRSLVYVYARIDYSKDDGEKTHANLAASYLANGVKEVVPHDMADVLMEGATQMGEAASFLISRNNPTDASVLSGDLLTIGVAGLAKKEYFPVTEIVMDQFKRIMIFVLLNCSGDTRPAFDDLMGRVSFVSKMYLKLSDESPVAFLGNCLSSIYSGTSQQSYLSHFLGTCESLRNIEAGNDIAEYIFLNINYFASTLPRKQREVFVIAVEKKSRFCIDLATWIDSIANALIVVSGYEACPDHIREELQDHAYSLLCVFTWIPDEKEAIAHIEHSEITDKLFLASIKAWQLGFHDYSYRVQKLLMGWTFKAGKYLTGWGILEKGLCGLCVLAVRLEGDNLGGLLLESVGDAASGISQELRDRAARSIREEAENLGGRGGIYGTIGAAMAGVDREPLRTLIQDIAKVLSPDTADEPVNHPLIF